MATGESQGALVTRGGGATAVVDPKPGRLSSAFDGIHFQHEAEFAPMCSDRASNGYNSGMGEMCAVAHPDARAAHVQV